MRKLKLETTLLKLREEATEVKQCYTEFSFKAFILATIFFGFVAKFFPKHDTENFISHILAWLLCGIVIAVLLRVSRIGFHKFSTANRNYGFELHINRTYDYQIINQNKLLESKIRKIGWEEAMCAWRIVQPIIFDKIYNTKPNRNTTFRPYPIKENKFKSKSGIEKYHWWDTRYLMNFESGESKIPFHAAAYLRNTQNLNNILCLSVAIVWIISYCYITIDIHEFLTSKGNLINYTVSIFLCIIGTFYFLYLLINTIRRQVSQRKLLESGLLSIQSCAVVWRLVVMAHLKAVEKGSTNNPYRGYTRRLKDYAIIIKDNIFEIHETIMNDSWPLQK